MVTQSSFLPRNIESFDVFCAGVRTSRGILTIAGLFISIWREVYYSWSRKWTLPHRTGSSIIGGWVGGRRLGPHRRTAARRRLRAPQRYHGRARKYYGDPAKRKPAKNPKQLQKQGQLTRNANSLLQRLTDERRYGIEMHATSCKPIYGQLFEWRVTRSELQRRRRGRCTIRRILAPVDR